MGNIWARPHPHDITSISIIFTSLLLSVVNGDISVYYRRRIPTAA
jgi:hypothetical protein